jgi:hypothetical protein
MVRAKPRKDSYAFRHRDQTGMPANGRAMKLGPMETILDLEDTLRILARGMAQLGDYAGASRNAALLLSAKFRTKELELKGLNMDGTAPEVKITLTDYAQVHDEEVVKNKALKEEVEALRGQIAAMQGKERPRPPRPVMN